MLVVATILHAHQVSNVYRSKIRNFTSMKYLLLFSVCYRCAGTIYVPEFASYTRVGFWSRVDRRTNWESFTTCEVSTVQSSSIICTFSWSKMTGLQGSQRSQSSQSSQSSQKKSRKSSQWRKCLKVLKNEIEIFSKLLILLLFLF